MERANIDGITLEYEVKGSGEPVVIIHGGFIAAEYVPLVAEPVLRDRFRLVRYHRRGYAGSSRADGPLPISRQAADCLALIRSLGIQQAHVVGQVRGTKRHQGSILNRSGRRSRHDFAPGAKGQRVPLVVGEMPWCMIRANSGMKCGRRWMTQDQAPITC